MTTDRAAQLGKILAELHLAANSFESEHHRYRLDLDYIVHEPLKLIEKQKKAGDKNPGYDELLNSLHPIEDLIDKVESLDISGDEFGIIHADLHPGNMHLEGDQFKIFDFDHCAFGWRAYDLCTSYILPESLRDQLLAGYESVRPLSEGERECIPMFAKLRRLWDIGDYLAMDPVTTQNGG